MGTVYNITKLTKIDTISGLVGYANDSSNQILMGFGIMVLFFIFLIVLKRYEFTKAFLASSFACFVLSLVLTNGDWLNFIYPLFFLAAASFMGLYMYVTRQS